MGVIFRIFYAIVFIVLFAVGAVGAVAVTQATVEGFGFDIVLERGFLEPLIARYHEFREAIIIPQIFRLTLWFGIPFAEWMADAFTLYYFLNLGVGVLLTSPSAFRLTGFSRQSFAIVDKINATWPGTRGIVLTLLAVVGPVLGLFVLLGLFGFFTVMVVFTLMTAFVVLNPAGLAIFFVVLLGLFVFFPYTALVVFGLMGILLILGFVANALRSAIDRKGLFLGLSIGETTSESLRLSVASIWIGLIVVFALLIADATWVLLILDQLL